METQEGDGHSQAKDKGLERIFSLQLSEGTNPVNTLILNSSLHNCETMNFSSFKPWQPWKCNTTIIYTFNLEYIEWVNYYPRTGHAVITGV